MQQTYELHLDMMWQLLRAEICGSPLAVKTLTQETVDAVFSLANAYDLGHVIAKAVLERKLLPNGDTAVLKKSVYVAMLRYERISQEKTLLTGLLEQEGITYILLKGTVLRESYPEPWLRTSCDIDVLVPYEAAQRTAELLVRKLGYTNEGYDAHNISLFTPGGLHIELHHALMEEGRFPKAQKILEGVWEHSARAEHGAMEMSDEMFYFHHILHMAGHIHTGGCGIRPLVDQWILDERMPHDPEKRDALLEQGGLLTFANCARKLMRVWMMGEAHDARSRQLENYILQGGVFGSVKNETMIQQARIRGGSFRYVWNKIFMPYEPLKALYPRLQRHKWMYPWYVLARLCKIIRQGRWRTFPQRLKESYSVDNRQREAMRNMLNDIGL